MIPAIQLGQRFIGPGHPVFIIAEAGVNHNGDLALAKQLIDVAAKAGADAVKFQTFQAEKVVSPSAPKAEYQLQTTSPAESQLEMLKRLELSPDAHQDLQAYAHQQGILFLSTPFDPVSVDLLATLDLPLFKIASGELTNLPFLEYVARQGKPVLLSTGMSYLAEVEEAVSILRQAGCDQVALLHCVSNYPTHPHTVNLRAMQTMADALQVPIGFSDHTLGIPISLAAVALGACVIEKHFTLDRRFPGPDHPASLEPPELAALVAGIREVELALGHGRKEPAASEIPVAAVGRRSLVAAVDIPEGTVLTEDLIAISRPGTGLPPKLRSQLLSCRVRVSIPAGTLLTLEMLEPPVRPCPPV